MKIDISEVANLPSRFGTFKIQSFKEGIKEHLVIYKEPLHVNPLVRIHSECLTGDTIGSLKCDCRAHRKRGWHGDLFAPRRTQYWTFK